MRESQKVGIVTAVTVGALLLFLLFSDRVLGVRYTYTLTTVAIGGAVLGLVSGVLGCFAVLRKQSLLGDALSHAALPGVAVAFLLFGRNLPLLLLGAGIASGIGVLFLRIITRHTRIKEDAGMGIVLAGWFALGLMLLTYLQSTPDASQAGLDTFIFGQAAAIARSDVLLMGVVGAGALLVIAAFWKELKVVTFDPEFASVSGLPTGALGGILSVLIVIAIVLGLQLAGVVLMVGMLIAPGVAARQWTNRLDRMLFLAGLFGVFAGSSGSVLSALDTDIPTGPSIIVVAFVVVMLSILLAPERGVLHRLASQRKDRRGLVAIRLIRDIYHYSYDHGGPGTEVPEAFLLGLRGNLATRGLRRLFASGLVVRIEDHSAGTTWALTEHGVEVAASDARNQRLWDLYRVLGHELGLERVAEERGRDIRALLPEDDVERLEELLPDKGIEPRVRS